MENLIQIAKELHERIACGCHRDPCWTCAQVSKRYIAMIREDNRVNEAQDSRVITTQDARVNSAQDKPVR